MNAYFLEYLISSTSILLVLIIGALVILLLNQNLRTRNLERTLQERQKDIDIIQTVFTSTQMPYIVINENGIITNVNDRAVELLDKKREDLIGTLFDSFVIIQSSQREMDRLKSAVRQKKPYEFESNLRLQDQMVNCRLILTGLLHGDEARYLVGIASDLENNSTDFENNLRDERINRLEDMAGAGFFIFYHETNEMRWSRGMYKILGEKVNETQPSLNFVSQIKTTNEELQNIILSIQDMKPFRTRIKIKGNDQRIHYVDLEITHQEGINHNNITIGILKSITDLDALFNNVIIDGEEWLIDNPSFFFSVITDGNNRVVDLNRALENYLSKAKEDLLGLNFSKLLDGRILNDNEKQMIIEREPGELLIFKKIDLTGSTKGFTLSIGTLVETETDYERVA